MAPSSLPLRLPPPIIFNSNGLTILIAYSPITNSSYDSFVIYLCFYTFTYFILRMGWERILAALSSMIWNESNRTTFLNVNIFPSQVPSTYYFVWWTIELWNVYTVFNGIDPEVEIFLIYGIKLNPILSSENSKHTKLTKHFRFN